MNKQNENKDTSHDTSEKSSGESSEKFIENFSGNDSSLNELVRQEQTIAHNRVKSELGREPTQDETNQWLNEHTESH